MVCRGCRIIFDNKLLFRVVSIFGSGVSQLGRMIYIYVLCIYINGISHENLENVNIAVS